MKRIIPLFIITLLALTAFTNSEERFIIDTNRSEIKWKAGKVTGEHEGTIRLLTGSLSITNNSIKSGTFTINMASITVTDLKGQSRNNLLNHLKSDAFFSVADNPTSRFEITKVNPVTQNSVTITGNLTIKGITNEISFPAVVKREKNIVTAVANNIKVDRTKYNIKYRSKSFFGDIGDKAIDDEFELSVNLIARK